ncbi:expansin EXLX1 family cellulose-binding protein [Actinoplanes sp. NEAU-A12]|uniref:Expansin EXLX1 family cellulose-binding protein n=1 Tax=Actinoplanes sandaracinus TaxID=3045177 RepID=A0ABT6WQ39_9ACTN|nr:expansin EXLX1 family cellulose-binding protein [Actinoplanes sandaracinus]MDI6101861.1 expansin EXLX1 family cellulose-binding protein [Actinoplanes sandaracinus]
MSAQRSRFNVRWLAAGGAAVLAGIIGVSMLLLNGGSACAAPPGTTFSNGKATFYDLAGTSGNCSLEVPADDLYVALGPSQYSKGASCGAYLDVTGPKGQVRVKVFDSCPECPAGHLDLSRTAFKKIGTEIDGIIPIKYKLVTNPSTPAPITVRIKEGASQYWFAARIDNHANLLSSVKVASGNGSFKTAHRTDFNYWLIDAGAGPGPYKMQITDVYGNTATLTDVKMSPGTVQKTGVRITGGSTAVTSKTTAPTAKATTSAPAITSKPATPSASATSAAPTLESASTAPSAAPAETTPEQQPLIDLAAAQPAPAPASC